MIGNAGGIGINLYPNPASATLTLSVNSSAAGTVDMNIMDLSGRVVMNLGGLTLEAGEAREVRLDVSGIQDGTYMLVTNDGGVQHVQRFVVKH
jgi:hypothetical protein